jgi:ubiquitin carboxyl-terminal hydrolase 25/28
MPIEVLSVLRTYLSDALNKNPAEKKRIAVRNKRFLLAFSDDCDEIFEYLEFGLLFEPNSDGVSLSLQHVGRSYLLHFRVLDPMP